MINSQIIKAEVHLNFRIDDNFNFLMSRVREKTCDRCQKISDVLYRIRVDKSGDWQFVCDDCWQLLDRSNPDYVYGGTWKARKR